MKSKYGLYLKPHARLRFIYLESVYDSLTSRFQVYIRLFGPNWGVTTPTMRHPHLRGYPPPPPPYPHPTPATMAMLVHVTHPHAHGPAWTHVGTPPLAHQFFIFVNKICHQTDIKIFGINNIFAIEKAPKFVDKL